MADQSHTDRRAEDLLDRALLLFDQADHLLGQALHEDARGRWADDALLQRAVAVASIAGDAARIAHALNTTELVMSDRREQALLADPERLDEIVDRFRDHLGNGATQRQREEQGGAWDGPETRDG